MKNVLVKLREYVRDASTAEKELVDYMLEHSEEAIGSSIHELAKTTYCSPSTIIRLCRKIGFDGYKEMQRALIQDITLERENASDKTEQINQGDTLEQILTKVTYKNMISLDNTRKLLDIEALEKSLELLTKCNTIYMFGLGSSLLVAHDAYLKFLRINKSCAVSDDWHSQLLQAMNINPGDLAFIISYSGGTEEMIRCAKEIKKRGAPILALTRSDESPLAKLADLNLCVASSELLIRTGAMSSRISQLNVIDIIYMAFINGKYNESMKQLKRTSIQKISGDSKDEINPFSGIEMDLNTCEKSGYEE